MANTTPYEIIAAPFTLWWAPVGTAFPLVNATPASPWAKVGSSGSLNYDDATGVTVEHSQTMSAFRALGDAGTRKMFRTEESMKVKVKLVDVTLEQYRHALNQNTLTTTAAASGIPGTKKVGLSRGFTVATVALLIRGDVSPYGDSPLAMQYEVPIAAQIGSPMAVYKKSDPVGLELEWEVLVDTTASSDYERFGRLVQQTAIAL